MSHSDFGKVYPQRKSVRQAAAEIIDEFETKQLKRQVAEDGLALIVHGKTPEQVADHAARTSDAARAGGLSALIAETYIGSRTH